MPKMRAFEIVVAKFVQYYDWMETLVFTTDEVKRGGKLAGLTSKTRLRIFLETGEEIFDGYSENPIFIMIKCKKEHADAVKPGCTLYVHRIDE
jgi:hypothetical protein